MSKRVANGANRRQPVQWGLLPSGERLRLIYRLTAPAIEAVVRAFAPTAGSLGLDAGCGVGAHAALLARAGSPRGCSIGLDLSLASLLEMPASVGAAERRGRVLRVNGDLRDLPLADGRLDWVWCADALWPGATVADPVGAVRELVRVVRPGGRVALVFWAGQSLLPGYPALEARLDEAFAEHTLHAVGGTPLHHHLRALAWLEMAGLQETRARTFVAEVAAPLTPALREALVGCFAMLWGDLLPFLRTADRHAITRLCQPESADLILDQAGYRASVSYTLFVGARPGRKRRAGSRQLRTAVVRRRARWEES